MTDMLRELYQEVIIDHNRHPRNFKELPNPTRCAEGFNPLCGDQITLYMMIENNIISEVTFQGHGCAISTASASLMTQVLKGKTIAQAKELFHQVHDFITTQDKQNIDLGKLAALAGVKEFPARVKCATLPWHTLNQALTDSSTVATTE